ncbi:MAG: ring-cleaving dioxygenase [Gemmobacter sp.]
MTPIPGLHHVTAICGSAQANADFFTGVLGQRLVKRTVNFDAPETYHLYYGDRTGSPGTIMTFFPFAGAARGRPGPGMASAFAYAVTAGRFEAVRARLAAAGVALSEPVERFGQRVVTLRDPDGAMVELVETDRGALEAVPGDAVGAGGIAEGETDGFHSVTLWLRDPGPTARILSDVFGYGDGGSETRGRVERQRLVAPGGARADVIDLMRVDGAAPGRQGAGSIHHVAFRAPTAEDQLGWMDRLAAIGLPTTPVIDRQYFKAVYVREPGGVLFEIATDAPGFAVDEPVEALGSTLKLPPQHEPMRARIERVLPPLTVAG